MAPLGALVALCLAALVPAPAAAGRLRARRASAERAEIALRREATSLESAVGTMDATIFSVAARLEQASELLGGAVEAPKAKAEPVATNATAKKEANATHPAAVKKNLTAVLSKEQDVLQGLFAHLKKNIKHFNEEETKGKKDNARRVKELQAKLKRDQEQLKSGKLSKFMHEALVNRTRLEEHELQYWSRGREIEHSMFHSNLKMSHGLMQRVKTVMEAYTQALSKGAVDPKVLKEMSAAAIPRAFVQLREKLGKVAKQHRLHLMAEAQLVASDE